MPQPLRTLGKTRPSPGFCVSICPSHVGAGIGCVRRANGRVTGARRPCLYVLVLCRRAIGCASGPIAHATRACRACLEFKGTDVQPGCRTPAVLHRLCPRPDTKLTVEGDRGPTHGGPGCFSNSPASTVAAPTLATRLPHHRGHRSAPRASRLSHRTAVGIRVADRGSRLGVGAAHDTQSCRLRVPWHPPCLAVAALLLASRE
jgi:hypothetical protein